MGDGDVVSAHICHCLYLVCHRIQMCRYGQEALVALFDSICHDAVLAKSSSHRLVCAGDTHVPILCLWANVFEEEGVVS